MTVFKVGTRVSLKPIQGVVIKDIDSDGELLIEFDKPLGGDLDTCRYVVPDALDVILPVPSEDKLGTVRKHGSTGSIYVKTGLDRWTCLNGDFGDFGDRHLTGCPVDGFVKGSLADDVSE